MGGSHDGALVVAVTARPANGKATAAALAALADAVGCKARDVHIVAGHTSRSKVVELPDEAADAVARLLAADP